MRAFESGRAAATPDIDRSTAAAQAARPEIARPFDPRCLSYDEVLARAKAERAALIAALARSAASRLKSLFGGRGLPRRELTR
jgi:hypothetical protein